MSTSIDYFFFVDMVWGVITGTMDSVTIDMVGGNASGGERDTFGNGWNENALVAFKMLYFMK